MQSNGSRIVALLVALAVIVALFFAFKGGGDDDSTTATEATTAATTDAGGEGSGDDRPGPGAKQEGSIPVIEVVGGQPQGGIAELEFEQGDEIRFDVSSDAADEVHVHGYDIEEEIPAGGTAKLDFPADLEGVFEVELHGSETQIAELTVNP